MAVLIHCAPEIMAFPSNRAKHFIQVPCIARPGIPAAELIGVGVPELPAPIAYYFLGQGDGMSGYLFLNVTVAQTEATGEPDAVADNLGREVGPSIEIAWG
jgi:hypothetical protein